MFIKYLIRRGESAVVVKYDLRVCRVIVGGYVKNVDIVRRLVHKPYFDKISEKNTHSQRNKVKYEGRMELDNFLEVMDRVAEDFTIEKVKRVDRLI